jgi:hypothetical protein
LASDKCDIRGVKLLDRGLRCYAVAGQARSPTVYGWFVEDLATGRRMLAQSGMLLTPAGGAIQVSRDGAWIVGILNECSLATVRWAKQPAKTAPRLEGFLYRVRGKTLTIRVKVSGPIALGSLRVKPVYKGYIDPITAIPQETNPFQDWRYGTWARPHPDDPTYYQATLHTDVPLDTLGKFALRLAARNKDGNRVSNYDVAFVDNAENPSTGSH